MLSQSTAVVCAFPSGADVARANMVETPTEHVAEQVPVNQVAKPTAMDDTIDDESVEELLPVAVSVVGVVVGVDVGVLVKEAATSQVALLTTSFPSTTVNSGSLPYPRIVSLGAPSTRVMVGTNP